MAWNLNLLRESTDGTEVRMLRLQFPAGFNSKDDKTFSPCLRHCDDNFMFNDQKRL